MVQLQNLFLPANNIKLQNLFLPADLLPMHDDRRLRGGTYDTHHVRYYRAGFTSYCPLISCMEDSTAVVNVSFSTVAM